MFRRCCVTVCFAVGRSQAVKAAGFDPAIPGSNPGAPANRYDQMVVRGPCQAGQVFFRSAVTGYRQARSPPERRLVGSFRSPICADLTFRAFRLVSRNAPARILSCGAGIASSDMPKHQEHQLDRAGNPQALTDFRLPQWMTCMFLFLLL